MRTCGLRATRFRRSPRTSAYCCGAWWRASISISACSSGNSSQRDYADEIAALLGVEHYYNAAAIIRANVSSRLRAVEAERDEAKEELAATAQAASTLATKLAQAEALALERAAKACEEYVGRARVGCLSGAEQEIGRRCASAIRALKPQAETGGA